MPLSDYAYMDKIFYKPLKLVRGFSLTEQRGPQGEEGGT